MISSNNNDNDNNNDNQQPPLKKTKIEELLSIEIRKKPPKNRGRYVTNLEKEDKYERRKKQNREAQRRARQRRAAVLTKIQDFQRVIADLKDTLTVKIIHINARNTIFCNKKRCNSVNYIFGVHINDVLLS